ncbi:hypothetical protein AMJ80_04220 [bacterium SM23_31]|nr:MAG: hypothetical protein AMJ80_04220 [bacterium SM23_31]
MKTILFIDDEPNLLDAYSLMLKRKGYKVLTAENGFEGIELILTEDIDLIITDIYMPKKNGLIMIKQIRRILKCRNIPIIVLSAVGTKENVCRGIEMGVCSFLTKPCNFDKLYEAVKDALKSSNNTSGKELHTKINKNIDTAVTVLLASEKVSVLDHFYEFLTEKFNKVYAENNFVNLEKIIIVKKVDALIIEVHSPSHDSFKFLFQLCDRNKCIGIPIIVISDEVQEIKYLFESLGIKIDKYYSKPFIYERLANDIYYMMSRKNIRDKLDFSINKIRQEILESQDHKIKLINSLREKLNKIKKENLNLIQEWDKTSKFEDRQVVFCNQKKIREMTKEIADLTRNYLEEKAELVEAERTAQLKMATLNEIYREYVS